MVIISGARVVLSLLKERRQVGDKASHVIHGDLSPGAVSSSQDDLISVRNGAGVTLMN